MHIPDPPCRSRAYALLYLLFGAIAVLLFAVIVPPYQAPDEGTHFKRADQISRGVLLAYRIDALTGGIISAGIGTTESEFTAVSGRPDVKATPDRYARAAPVTWANSGTAPASFPNTALYPPTLYLPQAASILVGKAIGLSVLDTLTLARAVTGIVSVGIGALAIFLAGGAAPFFFAMLSLPMTLFLMASVSQDGPLIALAALCVALFIRAREQQGASAAPFVAMCLGAVVVAAARPPYAVLAVLPLLAFGRSWSTRVIAAAAVVVCVALWLVIVAPISTPQLSPGADPAAQIAAIRADPLRFLWVFGRSFTAGILASFVGVLGWLDTRLPLAYIVFAVAMLLFAGCAASAGLRTGASRRQGVLILAAIIAGIVPMFVLLYLTWTPPGMDIIAGVQGRYLIPFALLAAAAIPGLAAVRASPFVARYAVVVLGLFAPLTIVVTVFALMRRYYFSS